MNLFCGGKRKRDLWSAFASEGRVVVGYMWNFFGNLRVGKVICKRNSIMCWGTEDNFWTPTLTSLKPGSLADRNYLITIHLNLSQRSRDRIQKNFFAFLTLPNTFTLLLRIENNKHMFNLNNEQSRSSIFFNFFNFTITF